MRTPMILATAAMALGLAGCSTPMRAATPYYGSPYGTSYYSAYSYLPSSLAWKTDVADGTRPYYCTEPRIQAIADHNTKILRGMAMAPLSTLPPALLGPQRKDQLQSPTGAQLEVWYFRSYVDSVNTSLGYDVGLTPIVVDAAHNVKAVGTAAADQYRGRAAMVKTLEYAQPCQIENQQANVTPKASQKGTWATLTDHMPRW